MDTKTIEQHFEAVNEIYQNFSATKGEKFLAAVKFLGTIRALDQIIGVAASEAFGEDEDKLLSYEMIVKQGLVQVMDMYFDYNNLSSDDIEEAQTAALMLSERASNMASIFTRDL